MKTYFSSLALSFLFSITTIGQDTFSIVAIDVATGEVGAAGASCVDLDFYGIANDDFIAQLFPTETGSITCQAAYNGTNQANAKFRMFEGYTPSGILTWLYDNDVSSNPESRQYGIVAMVAGSPESASFTGSSNLDYKNHINGVNYAIQGNILLGQQILDSMESRFLAEEGDLACKLMAALQGAKVVGADTRCATNGTSSLFAFVKVAQPSDVFGSPSFLVSVRTADGDGIEPIDTLQVLFDAAHTCSALELVEQQNPFWDLKIFPNPVENKFNITTNSKEIVSLTIMTVSGRILHQTDFQYSCEIDLSKYASGVHIIQLKSIDGIIRQKIIKR